MRILSTAIILTAGVTVAQAGTIKLSNDGLTRMQWYQGNGQTIPVPTTINILYGVFWGTSPNNLTLATPPASSSTTIPGIIVTVPSSTYQLPGSTAGQGVYMQVKGWLATYGQDWQRAKNEFGGYGETDIRFVTLGPEGGPGTVIWQNSDTGTNPNRFYPLILGAPLTPPAFVSIETPASGSLVVDEGSHGSVEAVVNVRRTSTTGSPALEYFSNVLLSTTNLTALAGQDYAATTMMVMFGPGETLRQVRIPIVGDPLPEPVEQFGVRIAATPSFVAYSPAILPVSIREARITSLKLEPGRVVVTFSTSSTQRYALESSVDLRTWSTVSGAEDIAGTGDVVEVTDLVEDCCGHRFYRTRILP